MASTVCDVGDQVHVGTFGATQQAVDGINQDLDEIDVLPFVEATDVVGLSDFALVEDEVDCTGMVHHIEPVAHVLALAIDRQRLAVTDVVDEQRYQLLGELVWPVVVGTVSHHGRHAVGVVERAHEVVAACFGSAVRAMGLVFQVFGEELVAVSQMVLATAGLGAERRFNALGVGQLEGTVDFVGADMVEAFAFPFLRQGFPIQLGCLQHAQRPHHIGLGKGERVLDGAVHMTFGSEVDDAVDVLVLHQFIHAFKVADVHLDEAVVGLVLNVLQVGKVAGVGQLVEVDDFVFGVFVDEQADDMVADEACTASDDDGAFVCHGFRF